MRDFLTQETPGKVFSLLGAAVFSMAFMLSVSLSEASFSKVYNPIANPFGPENVVAVIDNAASGYSNFLAVNLIEPAKADYGPYVDSMAWVWDNSKEEVTYALGLDGIGNAYQNTTGRVAGAYTSIADQQQSGDSFSMDDIYSVILE